MAISRSVDQSAIGRKFLDIPRTAVALAVIAVALDFVCVNMGNYGYFYGEVRTCLAMIMFAFAVCLSDGDHKSLGLRASPVQGWSPWIFTSLKIGGAVAVCIVVGLGSWFAMDHSLSFPVTELSQACPRFMRMCLVAPTVEEAVYRLLACGLVAAILGKKTTIALSGVLFGYLHVLYGNPSPENLVGGFFLAWSFLKSETILVPVALHSVGNLLVLVAQIVAWYLQGGTG